MRQLIAFVLVALCSTALADDFDGNTLLKRCMSAERMGEDPKNRDDPLTVVEGASCLGIIQGTVDTIGMISALNASTGGINKHGICTPPEGLPMIQFIRIINKFLKDNPEDLHFKATTLIIAALNKANLCGLQPEKAPPPAPTK